MNRCVRCNKPGVVRYRAQTNRPVLREATLDGRVNIRLPYRRRNFDARDETIDTCIGCVSPGGSRQDLENPPDTNDVSNIPGRGNTAYGAIENFIINAIMGRLENMDLVFRTRDFNSMNPDRTRYDMLITNGSVVERPTRAMLIERDEEQHFERSNNTRPGHFMEDRVREHDFMRDFRESNPHVLRIRVGFRNTTINENETQSGRRDNGIMTNDTPLSTIRRNGRSYVRIQNQGRFDSNMDVITRHIRDYFIGNGEFNDTAYINMSDNLGIRRFNAGVHGPDYPEDHVMASRYIQETGNDGTVFKGRRRGIAREPYNYGNNRLVDDNGSVRTFRRVGGRKDRRRSFSFIGPTSPGSSANSSAERVDRHSSSSSSSGGGSSRRSSQGSGSSSSSSGRGGGNASNENVSSPAVRRGSSHVDLSKFKIDNSKLPRTPAITYKYSGDRRKKNSSDSILYNTKIPSLTESPREVEKLLTGLQQLAIDSVEFGDELPKPRIAFRGKSKLCEEFELPDLSDMARLLGIPVSDKDTVNTICRKLYKYNLRNQL
jgi:hypothetical protein